MARRSSGMPAGALVALFAIALLLNWLGGLLAQVVIDHRWEGKLPRSDSLMEVALIPSDLEGEELPAEEEEEKQVRDEMGRLVQPDRIVRERAPDDTRNISEFDNEVDQQTQRPLGRDRPNQPAQRQGDSPDAQNAPPTPRPDVAEREAEAEGEKGEGEGARSLDMRQDDAGSIASDEGAAAGAPRPGIQGSPDALRALYGSPGGLDKVEDVDEGKENLLDSRRHRFASFFNRVRNGVAQHWEPEVVHAARDPEGKVYGNKTRVTRLLIRLNREGSVEKIVVDTQSGVGYLDEEAIRAVRAAQPFTNPPAELVDPKTGYIEFGFQFILTFDGKTRIHRYRR